MCVKRKIVTFLKNLLVKEENRLVERQLRTNYNKKRENLTDNNILLNEDKLNIINKKFNIIKNKNKLNGTGRFASEDLFEFCLYKREFNIIKKNQNDSNS
jgi:hypothetical protein